VCYARFETKGKLNHTFVHVARSEALLGLGGRNHQLNAQSGPTLKRIRREETVQHEIKGYQHDEDHYGAWKSTRPSNVEHTDKLYRRGCKNRA
jgi:hypothetical protein